MSMTFVRNFKSLSFYLYFISIYYTHIYIYTTIILFCGKTVQPISLLYTAVVNVDSAYNT